MILNKSLSLVILSAAAAVASANAAELDAYASPRIFWDIASETTVFPSTGSYTGYGRMIQLADGRLMAVAENSGIKIAFSSDKGSTWHGEKKIVTNPAGISECVPDLLQLADGSIIVGYNPRPQSPYSTDRKFGIRCKISTDGGDTWSDEIFVNDAGHTFSDGCWEPHFIQLPSGELQCYFADEGPYTSSDEQQISVCRSTDGGRTWSQPDCVSFRPGCRDGMPAAILLEDPDEIVVIVEDNGWYGNMGNFTPTTVRCPLATNWHDYHVAGPEDTNRDMIFTFKPGVNMAAPYIRKLANGYTVASCQGLYNRTQGQLDMFVAVGDKRARNFERLSRPFSLPESKASMWNSLAVIDDSVVVAVGGIDQTIRMIKGYPIGTAQARRTDAPEGAMLLPMGTTTRNDARIGFTYDDERIGFTARVADLTASDGDKVTLYLDPADKRLTSLATGLYRFTLNLDGEALVATSMRRMWGSDKAVAEGVDYKVTSDADGYLMELSLPWSAIALEGAAEGSQIRFAVEITDDRDSGAVTDNIADADSKSSATWMPLTFAADGLSAIGLPPADAASEVCFAVSGRSLTVSSAAAIESVRVYSMTGALIAEAAGHHRQQLTVSVDTIGPAIASVTLAGKTTINRKIIF